MFCTFWATPRKTYRWMQDWWITKAKSIRLRKFIAPLVVIIIQMTNFFCLGRSKNVTEVADHNYSKLALGNNLNWYFTYVTRGEFLARNSVTNVSIGHFHFENINLEVCIEHASTKNCSRQRHSNISPPKFKIPLRFRNFFHFIDSLLNVSLVNCKLLSL